MLVAAAEHHAADLRPRILEREIPVAAGRAGEVGDFPAHPGQREAALQQSGDGVVQFADRNDFAATARACGGSVTRKAGQVGHGARRSSVVDGTCPQHNWSVKGVAMIAGCCPASRIASYNPLISMSFMIAIKIRQYNQFSFASTT
ncbi:hypothetical protein D9M70_461840 [compost metagenome]